MTRPTTLIDVLGDIADKMEAWAEGERNAQIAAEQQQDRHAAEGHFNASKNFLSVVELARKEISQYLNQSNKQFSSREAQNIVNSADAQYFRWLLKHYSGIGKNSCWIGGVEFQGQDIRDAIDKQIEKENS